MTATATVWTLVGNQGAITERAGYFFESVADMKLADMANGETAATGSYADGWETGDQSPKGGAVYNIVTAAKFTSITGLANPDEYRDHTLNNANIAMLDRSISLRGQQWIHYGSAAYISATQFKFSGVDVTDELSVGDRVFLEDSDNSANNRYGEISAIAYVTDTTVTVADITDNTGTTSTLHASMDTAFVSIINGYGFSIPSFVHPIANAADPRFGGLFDGVTDDTAAINAALAAEDYVYLPGPTVISSSITLKANNHLFGAGRFVSTLTGTSGLSGANMISADGVDNVEIHDIGVIGDSGNLPLTNIFIQNSSNSKVYNCQARYASHEGIALNQSVYNTEVNGNLVRDISTSIGWGIGLFHDIQRCQVHHNVILDCAAYGILLDDGTTAQADPLPCIDNHIHNNIVHTTTTNMWGIGVEGSTDNTIEFNTINTISTYGVDISDGNSATSLLPKRNIIQSNIINSKTTTATSGVRINAGEDNKILDNIIRAGDIGISVTTGSSTDPMTGNEIKGNTLSGFAGVGAATNAAIILASTYADGIDIVGNKIISSGGKGIYAQNGTNISIYDNKISNTQKEGILIESAVITGLFIQRNEILNAGVAAAATYGGITVNATGASITDCVVSDNIINDDQGSPTTWAGVIMQGTGAVFVRTQVFDNVTVEPTIAFMLLLNPTTINGKVIPQAITGGAVAPTTLKDGDIILVDATSNVTVGAPPGHKSEGARVTFIVTQDGTGSWTTTWNAAYTQAWSDTGNIAGAVASITFINQGGQMIQESFSAYM